MQKRTYVSYIGAPKDNTAMYITKKAEHLLANLELAENCCVFCENTIDVPASLSGKHNFVMTDNPQFEYMRYVNKIAKEIEAINRKRKYTLTEQGYYIGENVTIGANSWIEPMCLIGHDVVIGDNAVIRAGAVIKNAVIGNNLLANEYCAIGMNAFTMARNENDDLVRIPTLGRVIIGDNVEVGVFTNISASSASDTVIGDNVKLDVLIQVGHDVHLEKNVEVTAGTILGGFVKACEGTFFGLNSTMKNRVNTGEGSIIGMGSVVTKSVENRACVVGNPARPLEKKDK